MTKDTRLGSPKLAASVQVGDWVLTDYAPKTMQDKPFRVIRVREGTFSQSGRTVDLAGLCGDLDAAWVREIVEASGEERMAR